MVRGVWCCGVVVCGVRGAFCGVWFVLCVVCGVLCCMAFETILASIFRFVLNRRKCELLTQGNAGELSRIPKSTICISIFYGFFNFCSRTPF